MLIILIERLMYAKIKYRDKVRGVVFLGENNQAHLPGKVCGFFIEHASSTQNKAVLS